MSVPYCVLIGMPASGRPDIDSASLVEAGLDPVFESLGIRVFASGHLPLTLLPNGCGVILGTVFARGDPARTTQMLDRLPEQGDAARWMIERMWGRYLAILIDTSKRAIDVLRDPTSLMPCFSASNDGVTAFASNARVLRHLDIIRGTIDWPTLGLPLACPDLRLDRTALAGINDPTPGQVIRIRPTGMDSRTLWTPAQFCRSDGEMDFADAAEATRNALGAVMSAWSGSTDKILLSLSGGLDSSIIASSIPTPQTHLAAFNLRSGGGRGDERDYARELAKAIGIDLEEFDISRSPVDVGISLAADLPNASACCFTQPADHLASALADRVGATAHMNGGGGDNVFAYLHSANPAADRLRAHGPGRGFARTVHDLAELTQCTVPYVGWRAVNKAWLRPNRYRWPRLAELLTADFLDSLPEHRHPWLDGEERLRPGQREHVAVLARALFYTHHLNIRDRRPTIYPLLSQPLVELCLSIPTWLSCQGGRDRAVARAAFVDRLPRVILDRRTKGTFDGVLATLYERNQTTIREMILDGGLVRQGIVCRKAAERALEKPLAAGPEASRLLQCVDIEAWATGWGG
jgi:asparagine synthase (glutamine-hydrolysing)